MSDYRITAHTYMGDFGQMLEWVRIEGPGLPEESELSLSDFVCERCNTDCGDRIPGKGVVAVAPDLFAGALPVCPSMNGESYPILENFPEVPTWIATSYIDHQVARHAYIMRAVQKLWDRGRKNIRFTIFTPEELAEYGIGTEPDLPAKELYAQNHNSWMLVYHNEYCMLDWLFSQRKKS